jgi:demethylmenaquinone methyltransferase / 2-methoxy-6-polyprenyl-1,4-benzoquinol methylase
MSGTTPEGVQGEQQIGLWVREMFAKTAPRYDLLNHVLSFNIDKYWRSKTVKILKPEIERPQATVVDLCCGTGDLTLALRHAAKGKVFGTDFCHPMLATAGDKIRDRRVVAPLFEADALRIPLRDASADVLTVAFGFRNLANYEAGLQEMHRVLRPGGVAAILEFSTPPNAAFASLYSFYSMRVLPRVAGLISGTPEAYKYLPESVRKFPNAEELAAKMRQARFADVRFHRMTFGIVALHLGRK